MNFSVIVPFLNEELYIERCVRSLLGQDFDKNEYELIFIDNGSTDRSAEIVRAFPRVIFLSEEKKNVYAVRNKGLAIAKGRIIAFTDADCVVRRDWLTQIYAGMKNTGAAIVLGKRCFPDNSSLPLRMFADYENAKVKFVLSSCPKKYFFGFTNNMAAKAEAFKMTGPFAEWEVTGDLEFVHRCVRQIHGLKAAYLSSMQITHLEVTSLSAWLRKINIYGEHCRLVEKVRNYSRLGYNVKLQIYGYCVKENNYPFWKRILFFFLLVTGDLAYKAGAIKGYFKSKYE